MSTTTIMSIPPEVVAKDIVCRLDVKSKVRLSAVCKKLRNVANQHEAWKDVKMVSLESKSGTDVSCRINGCTVLSRSKVIKAVIAIFIRSRPRILLIKQYDRVNFESFHRFLARLSPWVPDSIDCLHWCVETFTSICRVLLNALAPSLKQIKIICYAYKAPLCLSAHFKRLILINVGGGEAVDSHFLDGLHKLPRLRAIQLTVDISNKHLCRLMRMLNQAESPLTAICVQELKVEHLQLLNERARSALRSVCGSLYEDLALLPSLLPNVRRLSCICYDDNEEQQILVDLREAFFARHAGATAETTLTLLVFYDSECGCIDFGVDNQQTRGHVTANTTYDCERVCNCIFEV